MDPQRIVEAAFGSPVEPFEFEIDGASRSGWQLLIPDDGGNGQEAAQALVGRTWRGLRSRGIQVFVGGATWASDQTPSEWSAAGDSDFDPGDDGLTDAAIPVYALPTGDPLDVVAFAKTGKHNSLDAFDADMLERMLERIRARGEAVTPQIRANLEAMLPDPDAPTEPWRRVLAAMKEVYAIAPFAVLFADEAGLRAVFDDRPDAGQAKQIADAVLKVNPGAADCVVGEMRMSGLAVPTRPSGHPDESAAVVSYIKDHGVLRLWFD